MRVSDSLRKFCIQWIMIEHDNIISPLLVEGWKFKLRNKNVSKATNLKQLLLFFCICIKKILLTPYFPPLLHITTLLEDSCCAPPKAGMYSYEKQTLELYAYFDRHMMEQKRCGRQSSTWRNSFLQHQRGSWKMRLLKSTALLDPHDRRQA